MTHPFATVSGDHLVTHSIPILSARSNHMALVFDTRYGNVIPISSRVAPAPVELPTERPPLTLVPPPPTSRATYRRRRVAAALLLVTIAALPLVVVQTVFADRGGVPATTPAAGGHLHAGAVVAGGSAYLVAVGDTLWSVGERFHGGRELTSYVDELVRLNGGTRIEPGQLLRLPAG